MTNDSSTSPLSASAALAYFMKREPDAAIVAIIDGTRDPSPLVRIDYTLPGDPHTWSGEFWAERRADGSTFLYGEW